MKMKGQFVTIVAIVLSAKICFGQHKTDVIYAETGSQAWGGTGQVCNVCHEPFNVKYSIKQNPYWSHQVNAPTFRGNKLDGSPVLIKANKDNTEDNCQSCHKNNGEHKYTKGTISSNELEIIHPQ